MKLDKVRFATLIGYISRAAGITFSVSEIVEIDDIIDMPIPVPETVKCDHEQLHTLMALMQEGTRKIEAIKQHRMMTGYGLKESKDIVEKYWRAAPKQEGATLGDILETAKRPPVNFDKFEG